MRFIGRQFRYVPLPPVSLVVKQLVRVKINYEDHRIVRTIILVTEYPMNLLQTFFELEKQQAGWRFWLFWVIMTNIGFFLGLWLSGVVASLVELGLGQLGNKLIQNTLSGLIIGGLTGLTQGLVLRRHGFSGGWWTVATSIGWAAGIFIAGYLILSLDATIQTNDFFRWVVPAAFIAGAVVVIPQWMLLRRRLPSVGWWWILVSAFGWGIQFPGMFPGLILTRSLR